jgi:hypothetical protein
MRKPKIVGLAGIDKAIKSIANVGQNLNERVQDVAVAIVEHAAGQGNGDMSRALTLVKTVNRMRTLNAAFLVGYFRYFASTNINLRANDGAGKVSLMARDAKGYRGFDVDGARANNWYEAFGEERRALQLVRWPGSGGVPASYGWRFGWTHGELRQEHRQAVDWHEGRQRQGCACGVSL